MTVAEARPGREYLRLLGVLGGVAAALVLIGYLPTRELGGEGAVAAMLAGCGVSLAGSLIGSLPVLFAGTGPSSPASLLASLGIRFFVVLGAAVGVAVAGWVATAPFLVWVGISYLAFLVPDVRFAVRQQQRS